MEEATFLDQVADKGLRDSPCQHTSCVQDHAEQGL